MVYLPLIVVNGDLYPGLGLGLNRLWRLLFLRNVNGVGAEDHDAGRFALKGCEGAAR